MGTVIVTQRQKTSYKIAHGRLLSVSILAAVIALPISPALSATDGSTAKTDKQDSKSKIKFSYKPPIWLRAHAARAVRRHLVQANPGKSVQLSILQMRSSRPVSAADRSADTGVQVQSAVVAGGRCRARVQCTGAAQTDLLIYCTLKLSNKDADAAPVRIPSAAASPTTKKEKAVRAGRAVTVRLTGGGISIVTQGVAREGGARGEMVTVENARSGRVFRARVLGPDEVIVDGGAE